MRKQELARYRELLKAQLAALSQSASGKVSEYAEGFEELPDPNDRATRESEIESEILLRDRDRKLIPQVRAALARIEAGTFGLCAACDQPIDPDRLQARPSTVLCIECKRETERGPRERAERG